MHSNLFQSSSQIVEWLRKIAHPMTNNVGDPLPNTGIVRLNMPREVIDTLLYGGAQGTDLGTDIIYHFVRDKKRYSIIVEKTWMHNKNCVFIWDHRSGNLSF